jgi:hypothetical protein
MRRIAAALLAVLLALIALDSAVALARRARGARLELGRARATRLEPATVERLGALDADVVVTWFASPPQAVPARFGGLREEVALLLETLARASGGRLRWELVDPDASPGLAAYAAQCQVKPLRVRSVTRDAWSERSVWSTLSIAYGARPRAQIAGITPDNVGLLQAWITAQLDELERPRRPRIVLDAPEEGFADLERRLGRGAELVRARVDDGGAQRARPDLVVWVGASPPRPEAASQLLDLQQGGASVVVAGSRWQAVAPGTPGSTAFLRRGFLEPSLLAPLGVEPAAGPVLDVLSEPLRSGEATQPQPWRVRCIAPNQDFRALAGQPNSTLVLSCPTALQPDAARLDELALDFVPLATAGPEAWIQAPPVGAVQVDTLTPSGVGAVPSPKPTLAALLAPRDPRRGSIVLLGSASPLGDGELERVDAAHAALVDVLLASLASPERLVAARLRAPEPGRLPALEPGARRLWRALCVALPPLAFVLLLALRARAHLAALRPRRVLLPVAGVVAALAGLAAATSAARGLDTGRLDLTRAGLHGLAPQTRAVAALLESPLEAELAFSRALPPALAGLPARVEDLLRELGRTGEQPLELRRRAVETLSPAQLEALEARGAAALDLRVERADETVVLRAHATLLLASGGRELALTFPDAASAEALELRLALALGRLADDARTRGRVVVVSDTPRLSPAEAHLEYQQAGRFAPTGADVYALARRALERIGFEVVPRAPDSRAPLDPEDLLVWLQPRRSIDPTLEALARHLQAGGKALVAAQHFNIRSRQLAERGYRTVHWPEPQFADLEQGWLAELGVRLAREVLCDTSQASLRLPTEVQRPGAGRDWVLQESTQPFQLRALASRFAADTPLVAGLGDQLFLWGNRIVLDAPRLARLGLETQVLMETSDQAWAIDWRGGFLEPEALAGPPASGALGAQPLAVRVRGRFPALDSPREPAPADAPAGELVLLGCSELFKSAHLARAPFRADQLLVDTVATLALSEDYGRIAARRAAAAGFEPPAPRSRLALRAVAVVSWPLGLALLTAAWLGLRARRARSAGVRA